MYFFNIGHIFNSSIKCQIYEFSDEFPIFETLHFFKPQSMVLLRHLFKMFCWFFDISYSDKSTSNWAYSSEMHFAS